MYGILTWGFLAFLTIVGLANAIAGEIAGLAMLGIAGLSLVGVRLVPADPPTVGLLTVWGRRYPVVLREGIYLLAPYFPFLIDVILVDVSKRNEKLEYQNVRCTLDDKLHAAAGGAMRSGGSVTVRLGITWEPDQRRLVNYINAGRERGIQTILTDVIGEAVRQIATGKTWEDMALGKEELSAEIVSNITGRAIPCAGEHPSPQECQSFLRDMLENGAGDVHDLGVLFRRFNVIEVAPEGRLLGDAEGPIRELAQRRAEEKDFETELQLADQYLQVAKSRGEPMTLSEALERVRINRGRAKETIVRSSGNSILDAAALLTNKPGERS